MTLAASANLVDASPPRRERSGRRTGPSPGLVWFARGTSLCTLLLIFAGGMVTSTDSGLAVPDWPLSYGMLMPPMVGGIFYEHGHRMIASFVGFLTLVQAAWIWAVEPRAWVRRLAFVALGAVICQGILGGLTVLYYLPTPISVAHACLAQAFFCLTIILAVVLSPSWQAPVSEPRPSTSPRFPVVAAGVIYLQLILGAVMRHTRAGLAIPDFPLALGQVIPPFDAPGVAIHFAHRVGALVVTAVLLSLAWTLSRDPTARGRLRTLGLAAAGGVALQVSLGAATVLTGKAPIVTSLHVATGAALLGLLVLTSLEARRRSRGPASPD